MNKNIERIILLNPGPATTTDTVKYAQVISDVCHREQYFLDVLKSVHDDLKKGCNADENYETVLFSGSGTIVMDAVLSSFVEKNGAVLIVNNGMYGQRAVEVCKYYGINYVELAYANNQLPNLQELEDALKNNDNISMVYVTHHETSTGLMNPIREISKITKKYNKIYVVDSISSYLMVPLDIKKDNIDVLLSSSQKGTMSTPGVAFIITTKDLILKSKDFPKRSYYSNIYRQQEFYNKHGQMEFTPPIQTLYALRQSLDEIFAEGIENKYKRHKKAYETMDKGLRELGFKYYIPKEAESGLLLPVLFPNDSNWSFVKLVNLVREEGFVIYPGQISGLPAFRLSIFGAIDATDITRFLEVLKKALLELNVSVPVKY